MLPILVFHMATWAQWGGSLERSNFFKGPGGISIAVGRTQGTPLAYPLPQHTLRNLSMTAPHPLIYNYHCCP